VSTKIRPPAATEIVNDLGEVRSAGFPAAARLELPALRRIVALVDHEPSTSAVETLLRNAIDRLGGGPWADAAAALLGLARGTRGLPVTDRRDLAAEALGVAPLTFQRTREKALLPDLAEQLLAIAAAGELRAAHEQMSRRLPAESRLAVQWVKRFEAYNRIWTPVYALGADLTAYRSTLLETDWPYDRAPPTQGPVDAGETQEGQAAGYARFALYRFAQYLWELRQFMTRYGGMWLFSNGATETKVSDAVYRIGWHVTSFNERDESWLRAAMQDSRGQELHTFMQLLGRTDIGRATHDEWQQWVTTCQCTWQEPEDGASDGYFPTTRTDVGIAADCQVHRVIEACSDYCNLIDQDWRQIADWYHLGEQPKRGVSPEALYDEWRGGG
jgi:hypothetical protein